MRNPLNVYFEASLCPPPSSLVRADATQKWLWVVVSALLPDMTLLSYAPTLTLACSMVQISALIPPVAPGY